MTWNKMHFLKNVQKYGGRVGVKRLGQCPKFNQLLILQRSLQKPSKENTEIYCVGVWGKWGDEVFPVRKDKPNISFETGWFSTTKYWIQCSALSIDYLFQQQIFQKSIYFLKIREIYRLFKNICCDFPILRWRFFKPFLSGIYSTQFEGHSYHRDCIS